jgi:hypothetical protein
MATHSLSICIIRDLYSTKIILVGDNIEIQCVFMLCKILNAFYSKNSPNLNLSNDLLGLCE